MTEAELYKELGALTKNKERWEENIPYLASLLHSESTKIKAKALWLLGETGLAYPTAISGYITAIASFCNSQEPVFFDAVGENAHCKSLLRERAVCALGRIGRGRFQLIESCWVDLFRFAHDEAPSVRLAFVWASENIATNSPNPYKDHMSVFAELLHDSDDRVRMEAPEMFRVVGKRRPDFVKPYLEELHRTAENDTNRVVRIHCLGAIRAAQCANMKPR